MKIALDYDATYTEDPLFWDEFITFTRQRGHEICLLTYRDDRYDWTELMTYLTEIMKLELVCTRGVAKKWFAENFMDNPPTIWIDDNPKSILENSSLGKEGLIKWRETDSGQSRPAV